MRKEDALMKKLYAGQYALCLIPFYSSLLVLAVTIVELRKYKASVALWRKFLLSFLGSLALTAVVCFVFLGGVYARAQTVFAWFILSAGNVLCILIQKKAAEEAGADMRGRVPVYFIPLFFASLAFASSAIPFVLTAAEAVEEVVNIEDTNGMFDTHVALIAEEDICSGEDWSAKQSLKLSYSGGDGGVESSACSVRARRMSGVETLISTQAEFDKMSLHFDSELDNGNMEIFVVIDGEIFNSVPTGRPVTVNLEDISGKLVVVRVAAESASFEVSVRRELG